jgi:hypothetical protein
MSDLQHNHQAEPIFKGLDYGQISTILASLRYFQDNLDDTTISKMSHFIDVDPLTSEQIDNLCIDINLGAFG